MYLILRSWSVWGYWRRISRALEKSSLRNRSLAYFLYTSAELETFSIILLYILIAFLTYPELSKHSARFKLTSKLKLLIFRARP